MPEPRDPAVIWSELDAKLTEVAVLQAELNEAATEPVEPVDPEPPIVNPPNPPEPQPNPPSRFDQLGVLPEAKRKVLAANSTALVKALAGARPGDRIEVGPGTFDITVDMNIDGAPGEPIIIHAPDGATFTGATKLRGKFCGISGVTFKGDGRKVEISDVGARVLRCLFDDVDYDGSIYMVGDAHPLMLVDFCKWISCSGAAIRSEIRDGSKHQDMMIAYNYILNHSVKGDNESAIMVLMDCYHDMKFTLYRNRFQKCGLGHEKIGQTELESFKTTGTLVDGNTIVESGAMNFSLRVANKAIVQNNYLRGGAYIAVHGDDHVIQNNDAGTGKVVEFFAGNCTMDAPIPDQCKRDPKAGRCPIVYKGSECRGGHAAPRRNLAQNNQGVIKVGTRYGNDKPVKVQALTLVNNSSKASIVANSVTNLTERGVGENKTTAREMTPSMVGPAAPAPRDALQA